MYCIYTENQHWGAHSTNVCLMKEDKDGNTSKLIDDELTLYLDEPNKYYTLQCGDAIISRGYYENIFKTISELTSKYIKSPDTVVVNSRPMPYEDYGKRYDSPLRKFKLSAVRNDDCIGIGIIEYAGRFTYAIHSLYFPHLSHKDTFIEIMEYLDSILPKEGYYLLRLNDIHRKHEWSVPYYGRFTFRSERDKSNAFQDAKKLAQDAIDRKGSLSEEFTEGIRTHD